MCRTARWARARKARELHSRVTMRALPALLLSLGFAAPAFADAPPPAPDDELMQPHGNGLAPIASADIPERCKAVAVRAELPSRIQSLAGRISLANCVADARMAPLVAGVLAGRGRSAVVFRGEDGLDELSISAPSRVWVVADGAVSEQRLDPADLGIERAPLEALRGADATYNSSVVRAVLAGQPGPVRDAVLVNAAAALVAAGVGQSESTLLERMGVGLVLAARSVDEGSAAAVLDRWVAASAS